MARFPWLAAIVACMAVPSTLMAQNTATTVQLPSFHSFGVNTTVSVPDSGRAYVGAGQHVSRGHTAYGPNWLSPQRGGFGTGQKVSSMDFGATIHELSGPQDDSKSMPLSAARSNAGAAAAHGRAALGSALSLKLKASAARSATSSSASRPSPGVAAALAARAAEQAEVQRKAQAEFDRGQAAEAAGNARLAATFYRLAALHATGDLRAQIVERFAAVAPAANAAKASAAH